VPLRAIIGQIAIVVFVVQRCVVKIRVAGCRKGQNAGPAFEPDGRGI
jgi:hypothetical protein